MKIFRKPRKWKKYLLAVLLLALLCVGAVELTVCFYQSPELYQQITAPFRAGWQQLNAAGQVIWERLGQSASNAVDGAVNAVDSAAVQIRDALDRLTQEPEPEPEPEDNIQLVDDEAVVPPPNPRASFTITAIAARGGREYLTGGARELTYFNQTADPWADKPYGTDRIGGYGCGPTAMAMVVSTLTDTYVDPAQMAQHCVDNGYWAKKHGSYRSIVSGVAEDYGLTCTSLPPDENAKEEISRCLATGQLIVALMGPGHFTNGGHFILLRGVNLDNTILVADPASTDRSLTTWDLDLILEELSASRDSGGPLWVISSSFF